MNYIEQFIIKNQTNQWLRRFCFSKTSVTSRREHPLSRLAIGLIFIKKPPTLAETGARVVPSGCPRRAFFRRKMTVSRLCCWWFFKSNTIQPKMEILEDFNLAERHKDFDIKVVKKLETQNPYEVENLATKEARIVYEWNRQVAGCYQRSRAFSRLKISTHSIVYGKIEPEHYVEDLVAKWFLSRFPMFTVMIESNRGTFIVSRDKELKIYQEKIGEMLPKLEKELPKNDILSELSVFNDEDFWQKYYESQLVKERRNKRYFLRNMPKKFHMWESLTVEKDELIKDLRLCDFAD